MRKFDTIKVANTNEVLETIKVWLGKQNNVNILPSENIYLTVPKRKKQTVEAILEYEGPIEAPIKKGDKLGILNVYISGELKKQINVLASEDVQKSNIFSRIIKSLNYLVWGDA